MNTKTRSGNYFENFRLGQERLRLVNAPANGDGRRALPPRHSSVPVSWLLLRPNLPPTLA